MNLRIVIRRAKTALRYARDHGIIALGRLAYELALSGKNVYLKNDLISEKNVSLKSDLINGYKFLHHHPFGKPVHLSDVPSKTINWFIPPVGRGSGGHLNIFRFVRNLESQGFECRIIIAGNFPSLTPTIVESQISTWFFPLKAHIYVGAENAPPAYFSVATAWSSAYDVRNFQSTVHRCYFVQDFEPWFFPAGAAYSFAEETYRFGFTGITAGTWLAQMLAVEYGMRTHAVGFSYDRDLYRPMPRRDPLTRRVFFYARPSTPRRAFELGMLVLNEVARKRPDVTFLLAGGDLSGFDIPFKHTDAGVVDLEALPLLYSQCDVALVLSFSNLSLLPLELMACGTPVVSNRAPCTEWLLNDKNSRLERPLVEPLAAAICDVLENPAEAARLRENGFATAHATDWEEEGRRMGAVLYAIAAEEMAAGTAVASAATEPGE